MLTAVVAVVSLAIVMLIAILAGRTAGFKGTLVGIVLLLGWVAWFTVGPKP